MHFKNKIDFLLFLSNFNSIGMGSQGICYYDFRNNNIYKIFHQFFDEYDEELYVRYRSEDILKFIDIKNDTFIWPKELVFVDNEIVGYISDYVDAKSLYQINPLVVDLNDFAKSVKNVEKDLIIISDNGVKTFDMMYNILYGNKDIFVIDHDDYSFSSIDPKELFRKNSDNFNREIMLFLVDGYFDRFISGYRDLSEMYDNKGIDIIEFISLFKKRLSEYEGHNITKLVDAKKSIQKIRRKEHKYERILI